MCFGWAMVVLFGAVLVVLFVYFVFYCLPRFRIELIFLEKKNNARVKQFAPARRRAV
jgi:uncharacterized membrane protein